MFYQSCNLKYEISSNAQDLEKMLGTSWMLSSELPFDPYIKLRACIHKNESIKKNSTVYCPTGIYIELPSPNFRAEVTTLSDLAYEKNLQLYNQFIKLNLVAIPLVLKSGYKN